MAFASRKFWDRLSDAWDTLRDVDRFIINAMWDRFLEFGAHDLMDVVQVDNAKSLDTARPLHRALFVSYEFNEETENTTATPPAGFSEAYDIDSRTIRIPRFRNKAIEDPEFNETIQVLEDGTDYVIENGVIFFAEEPPEFLVADVVEWDRRQLADNFGSLVGYERASDEDYLRRLTALWYALWHGPTIQNVETALSVPLGFPITPPGIVLDIQDNGSGGSDVFIKLEKDGTVLTVNVPDPLTVQVSVGDEIQAYAAIADGIEISELITDPGFTDRFGLHQTKEFFTAVAVVNGSFVSGLTAENVTLAGDILEKIKPTYVDAFLGIEVKLEEAFSLVVGTFEYNLRFLASDSLVMNYVNYMRLPDFESEVLDEATYESVSIERRAFDLNSDTIGIKDRVTIREASNPSIILHSD